METKFTKSKLAAAIGSATLAMALSGPANAVVVVGGDNGWEISFDGEVNQFYVYNDFDGLSADVTRANAGNTSGALSGGIMRIINRTPDHASSTLNGTGSIAEKSESRIMTGLLPVFFSFNAKSPTVNGLTGGARVSIAPQTNNGTAKNQTTVVGLPGGGGGQNGANVDLREAFFTVDGSWGQILAGRTLSLFLGQNILTDQTLFGVGGNVANNGGTSLGRIGLGYVYPNFNSQIRYTSPDFNGFKIKAALFDPSVITGSVTEGTPTYAEVSSPRFEGEGSYATTFTNGSILVWVNGLYQDAELEGGQTPATAAAGVNTDVTATGWSVGAGGNWAGFELMGSYYDGEALGTTFMLNFDSVDGRGQERDNDGFIVQGGYNFFGKAKLLASYGETSADETTNDAACRTGVGVCTAATGGFGTTISVGAGAPGARLETQSAFVVGLYYDVNSWLKLVAEYTKQEEEWHDGTDLDADIFAVGGFFFW